MELSKRLKSVADMVTRGSRIADIGCDHGYVSIYLVKEKNAMDVVAMDVNRGPLECARQNVEREGLAQYIDLRLSDGLKALSVGEVDSIICAGMGGRLVVKILTEGMEILSQVKELILQPQSEIQLVRKFLYENGFEIVQENMVLDDGKYYQMMRAENREWQQRESERTNDGDVGITDVEAKYGPCLLQNRHPVLREFLLQEKNKYEGILLELQKTNPEKTGDLSQRCLLIQEALTRYGYEMYRNHG